MAHIASVPDLSRVDADLCPVLAPGLIVIVPAKDEAETVQPAMETLLAQDYPWMSIVAVDDRSTDRTGYILEDLGDLHPGKLEVVHLDETAEGWMGKTFALNVALERSESEYVLFTEADVWCSPSMMRRALAYAQVTGADHLVVVPTTVLETWGGRVVSGFLPLVFMWVSRPWRIRDSQARWDVAAGAAFSLFRREALEELGGLAPQRLAVAENVVLGRRIRAAGMNQQIAFAPGLVLVHPAAGAWGKIRSLTKYLFSLTNFSVSLYFAGIFVLAALFLLPLVGLGWWPTLLPSVISLVCLTACTDILSEISRIPARYGWLYPLGVAALLWAMVRSMLLTGWRRGVLWRDTLYPLRELYPYNSPIQLGMAGDQAALGKQEG